MADEEKPEGSDGDATATPAAGESQKAEERKFSQADLNAIVVKEKAKAERATEKRIRAELDGNNNNAQKKEPPPASGNEDLAAEFATMKSQLAVAQAFAELEWKPSKEDAELLRNAFASGGQAGMDKLANRIKPAANVEATPVDDNANRYKSPGAPSGAPPEVIDRDATRWSKDYIERLRSDGTFHSELEKFRASLPGGGGGLFRKRIPKVS